MGLVNISNIFDAKQHNVVVEGITDHYYLSAFKSMLNKDKRINFIPACGVDNVKNLVSVLIGWGCNYKAVFDDDKIQGRKAYNLMKKCFYENNDEFAHEHILKIKGCDGIEDIFTKSDFEKFVIGEKIPQKDKGKKNSEIIKYLLKEMYARQFLEKIESGIEIELSQDTLKKADEIFSWIYSKFNIV